MDINTIKKELYKQKPDAEFFGINGNHIIYQSFLQNGFLVRDGVTTVMFLIPIHDKPDTLRAKESAQYLIRWLDSWH